jgi:sterol desaturase/sphingolipid hydroxylase (fatty acid hydroxylase superfamily)
MHFDVQLILLALAPVFLACIGWEAWHLVRTRPQDRIYCWRDTLCNAALALLYQAADKLAWIFVIPVYAYVYEHYRIYTWPDTWFSFVVLFLGQDFLYYVFHRSAHRVRWFWAAHSVHHSSERMNFSTAFRQSLMYPLALMWAFWLPLAVIGFPAQQIVGVVLLNLGFQFFVHTQTVPRLGWLEYVLNTPSQHRGHHACNPRYIDRNFAGVLCVWDRLFGSYVPEDAQDPPRYGIVEPIGTDNPLRATFHEWHSMFADAQRVHGWGNKLRALFGPPEWATAYHKQLAGAPERAAPEINMAAVPGDR